ncbi:MAG: hypothetical protein HUU15_19955, partial [Candidatus Brocadiae bacterium]|nr:hypothetical protein [Candidatus Brocadiia bacterium]
RVLAALGALAPHLARNADFALAVIRIAVHRLFTPQSEVTDAVLEFLQKFGAVAPEALAKLLWAEADAAPDRRSKGLLYLALSRMPAAAGPERLAQAAAQLLAGWSDSDFDCRRSTAALLPLGDAAVNALLQAIPSAPAPQRPLLIRLADQVCQRAEVTDEAVDRHARVLVELIRTSRKPARLAALESRSVERAAEATRTELAMHVLASAHDYNLDDVVHLSDAFLVRLGKPAIRELHKSAKSSPWPVERGIAIRSLDAILTAPGAPSREAGETLRTLLDLYKAGKFPDEALLARVLGRIAALSPAPAAAVRGTTIELRTLLRDHPGKFELLEAYSWAVSSRHIETEQKMNAGLTLLGLLDSRMPEDFVKETWTNDGLELRIDRTSTAHTVLIPTLVNGLVRIALSGTGSDLFLEKITEGLLGHWKKVTGGEVMWSPANVTDLAAGLGRIAGRRETPLHLRLNVIEALRIKLVHAPVARAVGEALSIEESSRRMEALCSVVARDLCALAVHRDFQDMDDRVALLGSLGRIAAREKLAGNGEMSEDLRRRCVELLFDGTRDSVPGTRDLLVAIAASAAVPKAVRKGISDRLGRS